MKKHIVIGLALGAMLATIVATMLMPATPTPFNETPAESPKTPAENDAWRGLQSNWATLTFQPEIQALT